MQSYINYTYPSSTITVRGEAKPVSTDEYNRRFNVTLTGGICYQPQKEQKESKEPENKAEPENKELLDAMLKQYENRKNDATAEKVKAFLKNPINYFDVAYLSKNCKYGIVANQFIKKGTVIGIYSSELIFNSESSSDNLSPEERKKDLDNKAYDMTLCSFEHKGINYDAILRANHYSDLTHFAAHAPSKINKNKLDKSINPYSVIKANVSFYLAICDKKPVRYYVADCDIPEGSLVAIDYGNGYWERRDIYPDYFVQIGSDIYVAKYAHEKEKYLLTEEKVNNVKSTELKPNSENKSTQQEVKPKELSTLKPTLGKRKIPDYQPQKVATNQHNLWASSLRQYPPSKKFCGTRPRILL